MTNKSTTPEAAIPGTVRLSMFYRDGGNYKTVDDFDYSNIDKLSEDEIMQALRSINSDELVPAEYDLSTAAPLTHPNESAHNNEDHCYIEFNADEHVSFHSKAIDPNMAEGDISYIIKNIKDVEKDGTCLSYRQLTEAIHTSNINDVSESIKHCNLALINKDELAELRALKEKFAKLEGVEIELMAAVAYTHLNNPFKFDDVLRNGIKRPRLHKLQSQAASIAGITR
jgi:hypothetical protein